MLIVTFERELSWPPLIIEDAEHLESALLDFNDSTLLGVPFNENPYATFELDHCGDLYEGYIECPVDCRALTDKEHAEVQNILDANFENPLGQLGKLSIYSKD